MIECPICSTLNNNLVVLNCSQCNFDFSSQLKIDSKQLETVEQWQENSVYSKQLGNIEVQVTQLKERLNQDRKQLKKTQLYQEERIITTEKKIEEFYIYLRNLTQHIKHVAQENTYLHNRLKEFIENKSESKSIAPTSIDTRKNFVENARNGINLEMIYIPSGEYIMGSNASEDEKPLHIVNVKEFYLGKCPITQAQYQIIMGNNSSDFRGDNLPAECVSWEDAREFCHRLSHLTGKKYSLPSESQWEYACRAGNTDKWCFGNDEFCLRDYAWYYENSARKTHPVGTKKANAWGLHDMHGNVWEWCLDNYVKNYHQTPQNGSAYSESSIPYAVLRGGSWFVGSFYCRSAERIKATHDSISSDVGFRVVCQID